KITLALAISIGSSLFSSAVWAQEWSLTENNGSSTINCTANGCNDFLELLKKVNDGDVINVNGNSVSLTRGSNHNGDIEIGKQITINGNGNTIKIGGVDNISLGANVSINNLNFLTEPNVDLNTAFSALGSPSGISDQSGSTNIYLNGNKLTLNNVKTNIDNKPNVRPTIILGSKQGKMDAGNGELIVTNSSDETKFTDILANSEGAISSQSGELKISLDNVGINGKIDLNTASSPHQKVNVTLNGASKTLLNKLHSNKDSNIDLTLNNVSSNITSLPLSDLSNLTLNNSTIVVGNTNIKGTLTLENNSEFKIQNSNETLLAFSDDDEEIPVVNTTINNVNTKDSTSKITLFNEKIHLNITSISGHPPKLEERSPNSSATITLPKEYEVETDSSGKRSIRSVQQQPDSSSNSTSPSSETSTPVNNNTSTDQSSDTAGTDNTQSGGSQPSSTTTDSATTSTGSTATDQNAGTESGSSGTSSSDNASSGSRPEESGSASSTEETSEEGKTEETSSKESGSEDSSGTSSSQDGDTANNNASTGETTAQTTPAQPSSDVASTTQPEVTQPSSTEREGDSKPKEAAESSPKEEAASPPTTPSTPADKANEQPPTPEEPAKPVAPEEKPTEKPAPVPEEPKPSVPVAPVVPKPVDPVQPISVKQQILNVFETLKNKLTGVSEKEKQALAQKTEQSLRSLAEGYSNYDFAFSIDATRVAEARLSALASVNGIESADNNSAFLMDAARRAKP
ncbi:hypothetical protein B0188_05285, partial [[Haemophilus] felis]